ncbi:unnamed protein product [Closterium sp. NIES-53]
MFELECLVAAAPHLASTLLCPEGDPDALDILTPRSYADAITRPYSSKWQIAMDEEMASWNSTGNYVDAVPPPGANIVDGMWIFRVKRSPGSPPAFKARYVARSFRQRVSGDHSIADIEALALVKAELHERHSCTDLGELWSNLGLQITRDRARRTITLTQSHMLQQVLQRFGFQFSSPKPTPLPTGHSLSAPPSDKSQRGQLRLAYVATQANTVDGFTKDLGSGDHQRFCTAFGLMPTLHHLFLS